MDYLDADEAAEFLGVAPSTLYSYVSRGLLESVEAESDSRRRKYRKSDLRRLRRRKTAQAKEGPDAADAMNWGTPSLETAIADIGPRGPSYRGERLRDVVDARWSFAEVASWLWSGERDDWQPELPAGTRPDAPEFPDARDDLEAFRTAVEWAGSSRPVVDADEPTARARALLAGSLAALGEFAPSLDPPDDDVSTFAELVAQLFGCRRSEDRLALLNTTLATVAEHGLNASAFAGRVAASTGADLHAAVVAALAAFSGPRHGGQSTRLRRLLRKLDDPAAAEDLVDRRLEEGRALPGFGHPLYEHGDPRWRLLEDAVQEVDGPAEPSGLRRLEALVEAARRAGVADPNLDAGLVGVAETLELPPNATPLLFACGRIAGWIAHAHEQRQSGVLLRPRSEYVGA